MRWNRHSLESLNFDWRIFNRTRGVLHSNIKCRSQKPHQISCVSNLCGTFGTHTAWGIQTFPASKSEFPDKFSESTFCDSGAFGNFKQILGRNSAIEASVIIPKVTFTDATKIVNRWFLCRSPFHRLLWCFAWRGHSPSTKLMWDENMLPARTWSTRVTPGKAMTDQNWQAVKIREIIGLRLIRFEMNTIKSLGRERSNVRLCL